LEVRKSLEEYLTRINHNRKGFLSRKHESTKIRNTIWINFGYADGVVLLGIFEKMEQYLIFQFTQKRALEANKGSHAGRKVNLADAWQKMTHLCYGQLRCGTQNIAPEGQIIAKNDSSC
jgi:hypothetical protein